MESKVEVSVIVPVYNVEKYVLHCLESLANQTFKLFEIIIVIDGAKDRSLELVQSFMSRNPDLNINLIEQQNMGLSMARNNGLAQAKGEFILFVDSDDYVAEQYIERLVNEIKSTRADMVICDVVKVYEDQNNKEVLITQGISSRASLSGDKYCELLLDGKVGGYVWNKIFRINTLKRHGFMFEKNRHIEDLLPVFKEMAQAKIIQYCPQPLYFYRQRQGSAVHTNTEKNIDDYKYTIQSVYEYSKQLDINKDIREQFKIKGYSLIIQMYYELFSNHKRLYRIFKNKGYNDLAPSLREIIFNKRISFNSKLQIVTWKLRLYRLLKQL